MRKPDTAVADLETDTTDAFDDLVTIEAPSVEEAMARLADELGEDARIVSAEKEPRGGIGGFFAKEMVVLTARRPDRDASGLPGVLERMSRDTELAEEAFGDVLRRELAGRQPDAGLGSLLEAAGWTNQPDTAVVDGTPLPAADAVDANGSSPAATSEQGPAPVAVGPLVSATPVPRDPGALPGASVTERIASEHLVMSPEQFVAASFPVVANSATAHGQAEAADIASADAPNAVAAQDEVPADTASAESLPAAAETTDPAPTTDTVGSGLPAWSITQLVRHGLPESIVAAVSGLDPADDVAWINAIATAVRPWCRPLQDRDQVVVGANAEQVASRLDVPTVSSGGLAPYEGSFGSVLAGSDEDRAWLEFVRGGRDIHLVLGDDDRWRDLLVDDPSMVSWIGTAGLIDALYLASTLGATLAFGSADAEAPLLRAQPVDIALAIRNIVGRN